MASDTKTCPERRELPCCMHCIGSSVGGLVMGSDATTHHTSEACCFCGRREDKTFIVPAARAVREEHGTKLIAFGVGMFAFNGLASPAPAAPPTAKEGTTP